MSVEQIAEPAAAAEARVKVVYEGETVDAEEISFQVLEQSRAAYKMADGVTITLDHEAKTIYRLCDKKRSDGSPIYLITGGVTVKVEKPKLAE